jgi:glycosyltransferase involved in cell wall biosynthesis
MAFAADRERALKASMHVAVVSYTFPPSREIGGRRWAKFSQQLARLGHRVSVVCADNGAQSGWYRDAFPDLEVTVLPRRYPAWLSGQTRHLGEKLAYHLLTRVASRVLPYNWFDKGLAWKSAMLGALEAIHARNPVDVLVVTGAPFSTLAWGADFKRKYPHIRFVADMRDPWTWGHGYGIPGMNARQKAYQAAQEQHAVESCDLLCFPAPVMGEKLAAKYPAAAAKMHMLPHAYDPDKFPPAEASGQRQGFIYGGTLYNGMEAWFRDLAEILREHPRGGFHWDIYSGTAYPLISELFPQGQVTLKPPVSEEALFGQISRARAYMLFFPERYKDFISTKFYEVVYTGTPFVYIGYPGEVSRFITENRLGVHILPEEMRERLPAFLNGDIPFEPGFFPIEKYSFPVVTQEFLQALSRIENPA